MPFPAAALVIVAVVGVGIGGCGNARSLAFDGGDPGGGSTDASVGGDTAALDGGSNDGAGQADAALCVGVSPAEQCRAVDRCIPSDCGCNPGFGGGWTCTGDCGGGRDCSDAGMPRSDAGSIDVIAVPLPDGGTVSVPLMCQVPTSVAAPFSVTFRFKNRSSRPLFRYRGCTSEVEIASCASSYSDQLANRDPCPCDCMSANCPACGACYHEGTPLAPEAVFEQLWDGRVEVMSTRVDGLPCNDRKAVPAGRYRVRLPIYATAADAKAHTPTVLVATADFELPSPTGGVVEIDISP